MPATGTPRAIGRAVALGGAVALGCLLVASCTPAGNEASMRSPAPPAAAQVERPRLESVATSGSANRAAPQEVVAAPKESTPIAPPVEASSAELVQTEAAVPAPSVDAVVEPSLAVPALPAVESGSRAEESTVVGAVPVSASRPSGETLDFKSLVSRLRKTKAMNLSAKLSVKNLSDDLLAGFRAYHAQRGAADLGDLRRSYDSLFQRLHSLLRDADPLLDRDIDRSRAAIWEILADPRKFSAANSMAGT